MTSDLINTAREVYQRGGAVVPIARAGVEYTDRKTGEKKVTEGKAPLVHGWQTRRLPWDELKRRVDFPDTVALGIVSGHLNEDELHNLAVLDYDGGGWALVYENMIDAWGEDLARTVGIITGSGKRHKWPICPDMPEAFTNKAFRRPDLDAVIELRGNRSNNVFAGQHPDGGLYEWECDEADLVEISFVDLYNWLADWNNDAAGMEYADKDGKTKTVEFIPHWNESAASAPKVAAPVDGDIPEGVRDDILTSLAGTMRRRGMSQGAIEAALSYENKTRCKPPLDEASVRKVAASVTRYDPADPTLRRIINNGKYSGTLTGSTWADLDTMIGPIEWEWQQWLACGVLALVASAAGDGKSALLLRMAATYLRGDHWPDGTPFAGDTGCVVWCEAEAAQAINLERAKNWGLPVECILSPLDDPLNEFDLEDSTHMAAVEAMAERDDVRLVIVDSLSGGHRRDERKSNAMMGIVKYLAQMARDTNKPFLLTHHLRKRGMFDPTGEVTLEMVRGSGAIVQPTRLVWAIDRPDPNAEQKRLRVIKSNLAKWPDPLGLAIDETGVTFGAAPSVPVPVTLKDQAADLLRDLLQRGAMRVPEIMDAINGAGLSEHAAQRAKRELGIESVRRDEGWYWQFPIEGTWNQYDT